MTYLARGDVALSVGMTSVSTLLGTLVTPLWIWLLASTWMEIEPIPLFWTVTKIVLLPVVAVPGAVFSIWHNVTGSLLASVWRRSKTP